MAASNASLIVTGAGAILARRYARALFALAEEKKTTAAVAEEMRALRDALAGDEALHDIILRHARLTGDVQQKTMENVATAAKFSEVSRRFLMLLGLHRRLRYLGATVEAFLNILAEKAGEYSVSVVSAKPLVDAQTQKLEAELAKTLGGKVYLRTSVDPELIGGLVMKVGSRQVDASVKGKLATLERQLKTQQEAA